MILTGKEIHAAVAANEISIDPYSAENLNPNSYNYTLNHTLVEISADEFGRKSQEALHLGEDGLELVPGHLYLGATNEVFGSNKYVMTLLGRSSIGRLGLFLNISSDLGHTGSRSRWTLEMTVVQPLRIYPNMRIGQVAFWKTYGPRSLYHGLYHLDLIPLSNKDITLR